MLTAAVRLGGIFRPLVGNFATKSVMYAMIARNWVEGRAGILYPTLDCLRGGERSLHMLEFSVSAYLTGGLWSLFGGSLDVWGRATAVAFSVASVAFLALMVRRWHGPSAGLGAGLVLALSPVSIIYGQNFMLDASLVFFSVATFYGLDRWLHGGRVAWLLAASLALALLLLTKVYMLVLVLPLGVMVVFHGRLACLGSGLGVCQARNAGWGDGRGDGWGDGWGDGRGATGVSPVLPKKHGQDTRGTRQNSLDRPPERSRRTVYALALAAAALAVLPAALWCVHALRTSAPGSPYAEHIYSSLQRNAGSYRPPDPLLRTPDFYRQLLDDLTGVILTPVGFMLLMAGFLDTKWRRHAAWLLAMAILVAALPRKFYDMNYYYMAVLPPLCVVAGLGWQVVSERLRPGRAATAGLLVVALVLSLRYAVKPAFVTPEEDRAVVAAGRAVQELTAAEEPVLTMHGATIDLLYYANRPGWAIEPDTPELESVLEQCRRQGAQYLVAAGPEATLDEAEARHARTPLVRGDGFRIYRLAPPRGSH
ncbi:MAG: glycosyltransferase family 39 protein [Planctomycetota bacterium]